MNQIKSMGVLFFLGFLFFLSLSGSGVAFLPSDHFLAVPELDYIVTPCNLSEPVSFPGDGWINVSIQRYGWINVSVHNQSVFFRQKLVLWCFPMNLTLTLEPSGTNLTIVEHYNTSSMSDCLCDAWVAGAIHNLTYGSYNLTFILETTFTLPPSHLTDILATIVIDLVPPSTISDQHTSYSTTSSQSSIVQSISPTTNSSTALSVHSTSSWSFVTSLCTFCAVLFRLFLTRKRKNEKG
ncbi:MAG: hypothetical protein ACFFDT_25020 [Candidatus Hodarchaeota archaeon]